MEGEHFTGNQTRTARASWTTQRRAAGAGGALVALRLVAAQKGCSAGRLLGLLSPRKGCGPKYRGAWGQPLTRGPEADETKTVAVTLPHRV